MNPVRRQTAPFRWDGVELRPYKPDGSHFKDISRQVLFGAETTLPCELRYFDVDPGGHSTLERHEHVHAVVIVRGSGRVLVGRAVYDVGPFDLVSVPPRTWHQFRAGGEPLGFLCLVDGERDRPERPSAAELAELRRDPIVAEFVRV